MRRKILVQVTAPAVIVGLLLLLACLGSAWYIRDVQSNLNDILKQNVSSMRAAQQMEIAVRQLRWHSFNYLIAPSPELATKIEQDNDHFDTWLTMAQSTDNTPKELELLENIRQAKTRYLLEFDEMKTLVSPEKPLRDFKALDDANPVSHIINPCREYLAVNDRIMNDVADESERFTETINIVLVLLGVVAPLAGILSGFGMARTLSRSFYRLSVQVQDMAHHLDYPIGSLRVVADGDITNLDQYLQKVVRRVEEVTSRLQKQQNELLRAQQLSAVGHLAASVAHEIRNPLTAVKMLAGLALRQHNRKQLTDADVRVIHDEVDRVEKTVQNLLDFARLPVPKRAVCDLREVVGQAVELVRGRATQQQVDVIASCPAEPVRAEIDRGQLGTVLVNLFLNALDAMPDGGTLRVELDAVHDGVELKVTDSGRGIAAEMMDNLFAPFSSDKPTGTGLGLNISKRIIEEHGGTIAAVNGAIGACFQIALPATSTENHHAKPADRR